MNNEQVKIKLFDLDKAIVKMKKKDKEETQKSKLPRIYNLKPDSIEKDYLSSEINKGKKVDIKKLF